jgi:hypothetical protein
MTYHGEPPLSHCGTGIAPEPRVARATPSHSISDRLEVHLRVLSAGLGLGSLSRDLVRIQTAHHSEGSLDVEHGQPSGFLISKTFPLIKRGALRISLHINQSIAIFTLLS